MSFQVTCHFIAFGNKTEKKNIKFLQAASRLRRKYYNAKFADKFITSIDVSCHGSTIK
jgi:hypothetical protein